MCILYFYNSCEANTWVDLPLLLILNKLVEKLKQINGGKSIMQLKKITYFNQVKEEDTEND